MRSGVRRWQLLDDGSLLVDLNARQEDGPQLSVKKLLRALGVEEECILRVPVTREMLILEARDTGRGTHAETPEAAFS